MHRYIDVVTPLVLIVAPCVDKRGTAYCHKDLVWCEKETRHLFAQNHFNCKLKILKIVEREISSYFQPEIVNRNRSIMLVSNKSSLPVCAVKRFVASPPGHPKELTRRMLLRRHSIQTEQFKTTA